MPVNEIRSEVNEGIGTYGAVVIRNDSGWLSTVWVDVLRSKKPSNLSKHWQEESQNTAYLSVLWYSGQKTK